MSKFALQTAQEINRRSLLRYAGILGAAGAMTATLGACGGPSSTGDAGSGQDGGGESDAISAVIGYGNNQSWDPTQTASAFSMAAIEHIYEPLIGTDPITREPYAALATEVPTDTEATSWTLKLREGAKWHDGKDVTVDDVVFTFERILDPKANVLVRSFFAAWLKGATKVDDTSVKLDFIYPFSAAAQRLSIAKILPKHLYGADGGWDKAKGGTLIVGSGPYKSVSHKAKASDEFEAFADYNGPHPANFKKMTWFSIVDAAQRVAKVSGSNAGAQIADNIPALNIDTLEKGGRTVEGAWGMNHMFLMFNTAKKPFDDVRVRQALFYAIDTEKMIKVGLKGTGKPASNFLNEDNPQYEKASPVFDYNPEKAKQLLKEAGATDLKLSLLAVNVSWVVDCLPTVIESWKAVGIDATSEPQDTAALFTKMDQSADYQVVAAASNPNQFGIDADLIIRYNYTKDGLWMKYTKWDKSAEAKKIFTAMDKAAAQTDPAKQQKEITAYVNMIAKAAVLYPVVHTQLMTAWDDSKLKGVKPLPYPGINLLDVKPA